jgi:hypothetical protein
MRHLLVLNVSEQGPNSTLMCCMALLTWMVIRKPSPMPRWILSMGFNLMTCSVPSMFTISRVPFQFNFRTMMLHNVYRVNRGRSAVGRTNSLPCRSWFIDSSRHPAMGPNRQSTGPTPRDILRGTGKNPRCR